MSIMMEVRTKCPRCRQEQVIKVPVLGYEMWQYEGALIQDAMPELSNNEREALMTGICPKCWDAMFKDL